MPLFYVTGFDQVSMLPIITTVVAMAIGRKAVLHRIRRAMLPTASRDNELLTYQEDRVPIDHHPNKPAGSGLIWQAQQELQRLTANLLSLKQQIHACDHQIAHVDTQARVCTEAIGRALSAGDGREARRLASEAETLDRRRTSIDHDRAQLGLLYDTARLEVTDYEAKIEDGIRRAAIAQARLATAQNSLRARQLAEGPFRDDALAHIERAERDADLAEAQTEALAIGDSDDVERSFTRLAQDASLARLNQPARVVAARRSTAA